MKRKTESMMDHVPEHDMDKLKFILEVKDAYNSGSITLEEGQRRLRERVDSIKPYEVACFNDWNNRYKHSDHSSDNK